MGTKAEEKNTTVKISEEMMVQQIANAVLNTAGVFDFAERIGESISKSIRGKQSSKRGIKISKDDENPEIEIYVVVNYGVKIPEVAWNIQTNVKNVLKDSLNLVAKAVNIHIQGVNIEDKNS